MEKLITIAQVIVPIVAAVLLGIQARKKAQFSPEVIQGFQQFVVKICLPCLIFRSCLTADFGPQTLSTMGLLFPFLLLSTLWAFRFGRKKFPYHNLPMLFCCRETGMIGIPLFMILFGADQAYRMGILDLTQAIITFPVMGILSADTEGAATPGDIIKQMLKSPMILLSILGIFLNLTGIWAVLDAVGVGSVVTETLSFLSQPVSLVMLFCVGYNFSLSGESRSAVLKLSALDFVCFLVIGLAVQGILCFLPGVDALTRWSVLMYSLLPASYLAPGLGRKEADYTVASGVCSMLTITCLLGFFAMAVIIA